MPEITIKPKPEAWIRVIDKMLALDKYKFAEVRLQAIRETIEEYEEVTVSQTKAILNIRRSVIEID